MKKNNGFTLVEIMIVLAIIAILVVFVIPAVLRSRMLSNDTASKQVLRTLSTAAEWYSQQNSSNYPTDEAVLLAAAPPYLNSSYCTTTLNGFSIDCIFDAGGYTITATPVDIGKSGTTTMTVSTGGIFNP